MAYMSSFQMKSPPSDGEILDDWEQMADSGLLDKKLQSLKTRIPEEVRNAEEIQPTHFSLFNGDGSVKPSVLGPPPQIKILKRPQHNGLAHANQQGAYASANSQAKPKPQVKTLQQKEAEYAEARLRILGEAAPANIPSPDLGISKLQNRMENLRTEESCLVRLPRGPDGTRGFNHQN
uniref:SUZ RNA-binding domain-containing n=1 Tax=Ceriodaphnia reticulata TaxID=302197 RepID=A0A4Y7M0Z1_9CRUS|nr:EOG090X0RU6 [Ceriodaphnia reticulata]